MIESVHILPKYSLYCVWYIQKYNKMIGHWAFSQTAGCEKWHILYGVYKKNII